MEETRRFSMNAPDPFAVVSAMTRDCPTRRRRVSWYS